MVCDILFRHISYRLGRTGRETACVAVGSEHASVGAWSNFSKFVTDPPEVGRHGVVLHDDDLLAPQALADGASLALLVVDRRTFDHVGGAPAISAHAGLADEGSVTVVLVDPYARDAPTPEPAGLDTRIVLSLQQHPLGIYPALDPIASHAGFYDDPVADEARGAWERASQLRSFIAQPMYVAAD